MKANPLFIIIVAVFGMFSFSVGEVRAQSPSADLEALVKRIEAKFRAGKRTEMELAREVNEFSDLLNKYRGQKTNEVAMILLVKAQLYLEGFNDIEMGVNLLEQVKAEFPRTEVALAADDLIRQVREAVQKQRAERQQRGAGGG